MINNQCPAVVSAQITQDKKDSSIGQIQSASGLEIINWGGILESGFSSLIEFSPWCNSQVMVLTVINNSTMVSSLSRLAARNMFHLHVQRLLLLGLIQLSRDGGPVLPRSTISKI